MKIKIETFNKITQKIFQSLVEKNLIKILSSESIIQKKILDVFLQDSQKLDSIDKKTKEMMKQYQGQVQSGEIDYQKMSSMIRTQLLKQAKLSSSVTNYSEDHLNTIALAIHDKLYHDEDVDYTDDDTSLSQIKKDIISFFALRDQASEKAKQKVASLKRNVLPGSSEWHIIFEQYLAEELRKSGF
ncbi:MAG: DUF507 family protein [bacterium]|nr:DUF507 family protein [bacterium]MBU1918149.1 DUF507 family protein [bacterium]